MNRLEQLRKDRKAAIDSIDELLAANPKKISDEIQGQLDDLQSQIDAFDVEIKTLEQQEKNKQSQKDLENRLNQPAQPRHIPGAPANNGLSKQEQKDLDGFRVMNVIRAATGYGHLDGVEKEMHQEGLKEFKDAGLATKGGSILIPEAVARHNSGQFRNDVTTGAGTGGERIATELRSIIDVIYNNLTLRALGATFMPGLRGDIDFPVMTSGSEPTEKAENATADEISPTTASKSMSPTRLPAFTDLSEKLIRQDSFGIEQWIRNHLGRLVASRMERMAINGSGSSNQPTGILNASGLSLFSHGTDGGAPTRNSITRLEGTVDVANALMGTLGYLTNSKVRTTLRETKTDTGSGIFVWADNSPTLNGYNAQVSNLVPSNLTKGAGTNLSAMIFGNWADLYIGQWGGIEVMSNPYTKMKEGLVEVGIASFYDVLVARTASFAASVDIVTVI